jgi:hypothetical protein
VIFVQDSITESVEIWDTFNIITMLVQVYSGTNLLWYQLTLVRVDYKTSSLILLLTNKCIVEI